MNGRQLLHERLQADNAVVPQQRLQLEVLRVGNVQLGNDKGQPRSRPDGTQSPGARSLPPGARTSPPPPPARGHSSARRPLPARPPGAHVGVGRAVVAVLDPRRHGQGPVEGAGEGQGSQEVFGLVPEPACKRGESGAQPGPPPGAPPGAPRRVRRGGRASPMQGQ